MFTETFSASAFSGPVDISQLLLSRDVLGSMGGHMFNVSFQISGHEVGTWGDWNMGSVAGQDLSFTGGVLTWDPSGGDLVLVLELVAPNGEKLGPGGVDGGTGGLFFDLDHRSPDPAPGPYLDPGHGPGIFETPTVETNRFGGFDQVSNFSAPVPEAGVWMLMLAGFGLCGAALRRRGPAIA